MTWASYEFKAIVNENKRRRLPLQAKVMMFVILFLVTLFWIFFFFGGSLNTRIFSYALLLAAVAIYIRIWNNYKPQKFDYVITIRDGTVKKIRDEMDKRKLPLPLLSNIIEADIKAELERIQAERIRHLEFIKKVWNSLILIPCGFLFALLFQGVFTEQNLSTVENLDAFMELILQILTLLLLIGLSAVALYIPANNITKELTGESELELCLDILKEIEMSQTYDNMSSSSPPLSK